MSESSIYSYLRSNIKNDYGVSALMANLYAESGLKSGNLQNSGNTRLKLTDEQYTAAVDNGTYKKFCSDNIGYGLAQWTTSGRKTEMYNYMKNRGVSIGNEAVQLEFLVLELKGKYKSVWNALCNATSIRGASDIILTKFECPRDQSESVKAYRASQGQRIFNSYSSQVLAAEVKEFPYWGILNHDTNLRATASSASKTNIMVCASKGEGVTVGSVSNGWAKVDYSGRVGYMIVKNIDKQ